MTSTFNDNDNKPSYYATPLTQKIIKHGIAWLKGVDVTTLSDFDSMEDALKGYCVTLKEVIPLQQPLDKPEDFLSVVAQAKKFILGREWPENYSREVDDFLTDPNENQNKFGEMSNLIRRFIYNNVAKQTKVVAHICDGAHRVSAIDCAMTGILPSTEVENNYHERLTHANVLIQASVQIPDDEQLSSNQFVEMMKSQSQISQESFGRQQPHGVKHFLAYLMNEMNTKCKLSYFDLASDNLILGFEIEHFATVIVELIRDEKKSARYYHMVPDMDLENLVKKPKEEWFCLFQQKKPGRNKYGNFSFLWSDGKLSVQHIISKSPDLGNKHRYSRMGFNAEVFEMVQLLLFSRISKESYEQLYGCFTTNHPDAVIQLSACDKKGEKEKQWLSALVEVIGTSVYYSRWVFLSKLKNMKRSKKKGSEELLKIGSEALLGRLIKSSITEATQFFSRYGLDPCPPDWFNKVINTMRDDTVIADVFGKITESKKNFVDVAGAQSRIERKYKPFIERFSFISFIKVSFALHLQSQLIDTTGGKSRLRINLDLSNLVIQTTDDIKVIKKDVGQLWTTSITDFTTEIAPRLYADDSCATNTALIINKILDTTHYFPVPRKNKADANVAKAVEVVTLDMPDFNECKLLKNVLLSFKDVRFKELLNAKIRSPNITDEKKQQVKTLLTLIEAANVQYLETHYLTGQDKDDTDSS
jgi:hypothetical protein